MNKRNPLAAYNDANENVSGPDFEKKWYESVVMILQLIQKNHFSAVDAHIKLIEVCDGLGWIQENLNEQLNSQHRTLLKGIFSNSIQIINGAIQTNNMEYLDIVIASLKTMMGPYNVKTEEPS
jgi:hypothetical protein